MDEKILMTDTEEQGGKIIARDTVDSGRLGFAENDGIMMADSNPGQYAESIGTEGNGLCYADHVHPYTAEWKKDADYMYLRNTYIALKESYDKYIAQTVYEGSALWMRLMQQVGILAGMVLAAGIPVYDFTINILLNIIRIMQGQDPDIGFDVNGSFMKAEALIAALENMIYKGD